MVQAAALTDVRVRVALVDGVKAVSVLGQPLSRGLRQLSPTVCGSQLDRRILAKLRGVVAFGVKLCEEILGIVAAVGG